MHGASPLNWTVAMACPALDGPALSPGVWAVRVRLQGGPARAVQLAVDPAFLDALEALSSPAGGADARAEVGERLTACLLEAGWADAVEPLAQALQAGRPIRLTIESAAPALLALPWGLAQPPGFRTPWAQHPGLTLGWACPSPAPRPRLASAIAPERLVIGWAGATRQVPGRAHLDAVRDACARGGLPFDAGLDALPQVSIEGLRAHLAAPSDRPVAAAHLILPVIEDADGELALGLDDGHGEVIAVDAGALVACLAAHGETLRWVSLVAAVPPGLASGPCVPAVALAAALHGAGIEAVLTTARSLGRGAALSFTQALFEGLIVGGASLEDAAGRARRALTAQVADAADGLSPRLLARPLLAAPGVEPDTRPLTFCPYRGAASADGTSARYWFGREAEVESALGDLQRLAQQGRPRLLVVAGVVGVGRRSLLHAGLGPELAGDGWQVCAVTLGAAPDAAITAALAAARPGRRLALLVDDLEQLLRCGQPEADACVRRLWALAEGVDGAVVVAAMRLDLLGGLSRLTLADGRRLDAVVLGDPRHRTLLPRLGRKALRDAIRRPAERAGLVFEPGLVRTLVTDLEHSGAGLVALQYTLAQLWARRRGRVLTADAYRALGGVSEAVSVAGTQAIGALDRAAARAVDGLLARLVVRDPAGPWTAPACRIADLRPAEPTGAAAFDRGVQALASVALVRVQAGWVGLAHEGLIEAWPRLTRGARAPAAAAPTDAPVAPAPGPTPPAGVDPQAVAAAADALRAALARLDALTGRP